MGQQALDGRTRYAETSRNFTYWETSQLLKAFGIDTARRPTQSDPLGPRPLQPREDPLPNPLPLELRQRREDVQLQFARRCRAANPLPEADESDPQRLQLLDEGHQMPEVPAEAIEAPAHQHVEPSPPRVGQQLIERRSPIFRAADAAVDVFSATKAICTAEPP